MIIHQPHLCTRLEVWSPKYNSRSLTREYDEPVALLHKRKVDFATNVIIVTFPKARHLQGQRFAIYKARAQSQPLGTNGKAPMYEVAMSHFEPYATPEDIKNVVEELF